MIKCLKGVGAMKTKINLVLLFFAVFVIGCQPKQATQEPEGCTLQKYKSSATVLMRRYSLVIKELDIRDATSRNITREKLLDLKEKIDAVKCKERYPLKHETLAYSVKHMLDALDYTDQGDYESANQSINAALINVEQFNDWSVDVGE